MVPIIASPLGYSSSEKPRAQESFLKIKTLDLEVSKTLERGRAKNWEPIHSLAESPTGDKSYNRRDFYANNKLGQPLGP